MPTTWERPPCSWISCFVANTLLQHDFSIWASNCILHTLEHFGDLFCVNDNIHLKIILNRKPTMQEKRSTYKNCHKIFACCTGYRHTLVHLHSSFLSYVMLSGLSSPLLLKNRMLPLSEAAFILIISKHRGFYIKVSATPLFSAACCITLVAWLFLISNWSSHIHNSHLSGEKWKINLLSFFFLLYSPT